MRNIDKWVFKRLTHSWRLSSFFFVSINNELSEKVVADMFPASEILLGYFHIVSRNFYPYFSLGKYVREHFLRKSIKFIEVDVKWEKSPRVSKSLQDTLGDFPCFIWIYTTTISPSRKSLRGCFPTIENTWKRRIIIFESLDEILRMGIIRASTFVMI